jgi:hypothetical protein
VGGLFTLGPISLAESLWKGKSWEFVTKSTLWDPEFRDIVLAKEQWK